MKYIQSLLIKSVIFTTLAAIIVWWWTKAEMYIENNYDSYIIIGTDIVFNSFHRQFVCNNGITYVVSNSRIGNYPLVSSSGELRSCTLLKKTIK